jgi:hypothetical protein
MRRHRPAICLGAVVIAALSARPGLSQTPNQPSAKPASCRSPEHRQFDFWVGDWDAYDVDHRDSVVARNRVDLILDRCVLREVYEGRNGLSGQSFSIYDTTRRVWHQTWVTNRGQLLVLEGRLVGDRMVLLGADRGPDGKPVQLRGVWTQAEGGVRETAETSGDDGRTWKPLFDILFRRHTP